MADDISQKVAYHEAAIEDFGRRMTGVESHVKSMQNEMSAGFLKLTTKLDQLRAHSDAQPKFDLGKIIQGVRDAAILFSMLVAGIVWVVSGSFNGVFVKQDGLNIVVADKLKEQSDAIKHMHNALVASRLKEHGDAIDRLAERTQWLPSAPKRN